MKAYKRKSDITGVVYKLDEIDHSKVIDIIPHNVFWYYNYYFSNYYPMLFSFINDYNKLFGPPSDGLNILNTHDQRFAFNEHYLGEIHKYNLDGKYVESIPKPEFLAMGGNNIMVSRFFPVNIRNSKNYHRFFLRMKTLDFFWDCQKVKKIDTVLIDKATKKRIDPIRLSEFQHGEHNKFCHQYYSKKFLQGDELSIKIEFDPYVIKELVPKEERTYCERYQRWLNNHPKSTSLCGATKKLRLENI